MFVSFLHHCVTLIRNGCRLRIENIRPVLFREYVLCITESKLGRYNL